MLFDVPVVVISEDGLSIVVKIEVPVVEIDVE